MAAATIPGAELRAPSVPVPVSVRFGVDRPDPKFRSPRAGRRSVRRSDLLDRLEQERDCQMVLLRAPAGYGKTTLLAQWAQENERPCAWVTVDDADADPGVLADSIAHALTASAITPGRGAAFALILDDAHVVGSAVLRDAVLDVLGWLPEGSQLAVSSRCEPALALGRMRAGAEVIELGIEDLAMSPVEATEALRQAGVDPGLTPVQTLVDRAEGWPAALALATAWAHRAQESEAVDPLGGDDHLFSDYFGVELLASLPPQMLRFLMHGSVLDRLSGPLCDEVLGRERSAAMLAELARRNVPLRPLDPRHEWYRLHGLFREMLQAHLRHAEPEIAPVLHRRAAAWYRHAGDVDRSLDHAAAAGDLDSTGELLWANLRGFLGEGRNHMVQQWLSGVSVERFTGSARLALAAAHSHLALGRAAVAEQWARSAAVRLAEAPEHISEPERAGVLIVQAWAARGGPAKMRLAASQAYELLPDDSPWRASCCLLRGTAALLTGDEPGAEAWLQEGAARGAVLAADTASLCLAQLSVVAAERGQTQVAADFAQSARIVMAEHGLSSTPASALVFAVWASAAMRDGRVDEAKAATARCLTLLDQVDDSLAWFGAEARILLARVSLALGHVATARELLADASRLARRTPGVVVFERWFSAAWGQFDEQAETALAGVALLTTAELRVLRFLPTHYSFHEIAQRLHVSSNTVKTHVHAVYRKLDASSRSEAVAHATSAGLLGC
jgi:LuxR family transcriptional regulator, maltose regulon positive regulatory protein